MCQNIPKCLKLNRPQLSPLSLVLEHGFLQSGLLSFRHTETLRNTKRGLVFLISSWVSQNIPECLKLSRSRLSPLSLVLEHGFLQSGLLSFRHTEMFGNMK